MGRIMLQRHSVVAALLVLLVGACSGALEEQNSTEWAFQRSLLSVHEKVIKAELIHRDYVSSTFGESTKSFGERFIEAVKRSNARRDAIAQQVLASQTSFSTPVSAGSGEYVMAIALGTPAQTISAIMDTGSDLVWTQCLPCQTCYTQNGPIYDPSKSSTYKKEGCATTLCRDLPTQSCTSASCHYDYMYGDGSSTSGVFSTERITFGTGGGATVAFGCGTNNLGSFSGAGGLVGLGQGPVSLISQLAGVVSKKFSYCMVPLGSTASSPLYLGNAASAGGEAYTPILANSVNPTYYYLGVTGLTVAGKSVSYPAGSFTIDASGGGGFIIDSGTTITYLETSAYNSVLAGFRAAIKYPVVDGSTYGLDLCYSIAGVANPTFPDMVVHFTGADFVLPTANLFVLVDTTDVCLAMAGSTGFSIFGNVQQQDHLIEYDLDAYRIGFKSIACDTL